MVKKTFLSWWRKHFLHGEENIFSLVQATFPARWSQHF
jgi:hypothetical protein